MKERERVAIAEAAERLGVAPDTIRRRLKKGELVGEKEATPQGFVWRIELPDEADESVASSESVSTPRSEADERELIFTGRSTTPPLPRTGRGG